jgi:hypothetical protein
MELRSKWIWAAIFCLSASVCANEADALRVDKVYKVLFAAHVPLPPPAQPLLPEAQSIHDALDATLPDNGSEIVIRTAQAIAQMTFEQLAEYSFVVWHRSEVGPAARTGCTPSTTISWTGRSNTGVRRSTSRSTTGC